MNREIANKIAKIWNEDTDLMLSEPGYFLLTLHMPISFVEQCSNLMDRDDIDFDYLLADAQYAYIEKNAIGEMDISDNFDPNEAKMLVDLWENKSAYKSSEENIDIHFALNEEDASLLHAMFSLRQAVNPEISIEDLFIEFIEAYAQTDLKILKEKEKVIFDELAEDYGKK